MYRLMRNTHLAIGLAFLLMALLFALSSLVFIYRPFLPQSRHDATQLVRLEHAQAASARALALELMSRYGLRGDLRQIEETSASVRLRIVRPGTEATVVYDRTSGQARIQTRRYGLLETLVQLHVNHGFHHSYMPANFWALLSLLASIGLLLLGATGLYLWFAQQQERLVGGILASLGLIYGVATLALARA